MSARVVGRYLLCEEFASGGIASVHLGLQLGDEGFTKTVAIKRLHPQFAKDPSFASALVDEGRMQARVQHPNVAAALDVVRAGDDLLLVIEYLHAASLSELVAACRGTGDWPPLSVVTSLMASTLRGLHAAHEARSSSGAPLSIVHRDVSPQNILVGADGIPRVVDFGIAHATDRSQVTREGTLKGKPGYMAPEQICGERLTRAADVYAAGVVLWELATRERLFPGGDFVAVARAVLERPIDPPSAVAPSLPPELDAIVMRAVAHDPAHRFATAAEFADALEKVTPMAGAGEIATWVQRAAATTLKRRAELRHRVERDGVAGALAAAATGASSSPSIPPRVAVEGSSSVAVINLPSGMRSRHSASITLAAIGMTALGAAIVVAALASHDDRPAAAPDPPVSSASAPSPVVAPPPPPPPPSASVVAPPPTSSADAREPPRNPAARTAAPPRAPARPTAAAEPCVTVSADGIKHWNPRCK